MYVCLCNAVNERRIEKAAQEGITTLRELCRTHKVGASCGKCVPHARAVLDRALVASAELVEPAAVTTETAGEVGEAC